MIDHALTCPVDQNELALRIAEACLDVQRPPQMHPADALAVFGIEEKKNFLKAAAVAEKYISECIEKHRISQAH